MEIQNVTGALTQALQQGQIGSQVESIRQAEVDAQYATALQTNPKAILQALGVGTTPESQVHVTIKNRANRDARVQRMQQVIVIIVHYTNCDADIYIIC